MRRQTILKTLRQSVTDFVLQPIRRKKERENIDHELHVYRSEIIKEHDRLLKTLTPT